MNFWMLLGAVISLYVLLNFIILPQITQNWKADGSLTKISRAGLIAAIEFLRDITAIGSLIYITFALLAAVLAFGFGGNVRTLGWLVSESSLLHHHLDVFKKMWATWFFLFPAALLVYLCWRKQVSDFKGEFDRIVDKEIDRLNLGREANPNSWTDLEPDDRMSLIDAELAELQKQLKSQMEDTTSTARENRQKLLRRIIILKERRSQIDYERRVNLDKLNQKVQPTRERKSGKWSRFFLSKGFFSDLKGFSKLLSRTTFGLLCIALIGAASTSGLTDVLHDRIVHLDDLRVDAKKREVEQVWQQAGEPSREKVELKEDDRQAVAHLAEQFSRALTQNQGWRGFRPAFRASTEFSQHLARHDILTKTKLSAPIGESTTAFTADLSGFSKAEQEILQDLAPHTTSNESRLGKIVADRKGREIVGWFGSNWDKMKGSLLKHAAEYREPVQFKSLEQALIDNIVSATFDGVVPQVDSELTKQARSAMSSALKKSVNEMVETELHAVMVDLHAGKPLDQVITKVRTDHLSLPQTRTDAIALFLERESTPRPEGLAGKLEIERGLWRSVKVSPDADQPLTKVAEDLARQATEGGKYPLVEESIDALAEYDDHFPRSLEDQRKTILGQILDRHSGGGGGGVGGGIGGGSSGGGRPAGSGGAGEAFGKLARLKVTRARSFTMLRGFSRVGGVLIGTEPENPQTKLDLRDLTWEIRGRSVLLTLPRPNGKSLILGPYDKSLVHQALAYAADGRPVAVTMTRARPLRQLKIHLHPSLVDTPLGCLMTELDRFVDRFVPSSVQSDAGDKLAPRGEITLRFTQQFELYRFAWAVRVKLLYSRIGETREDGRIVSARHITADREVNQLVEEALKTKGLVDSASSVFARKPEFFDAGLVAAIRSCSAERTASGFDSCITRYAPFDKSISSGDGERLSRWLIPPATFDPWSGVRERKFRINSDLDFLKAPVGTGPEDSLWPFDFIVQIAFTSPAINLPANQQEEYIDKNPIEFDEIKPEITKLVSIGVVNNNLRTIFEELRGFTVLQRLFRLALKGNLGDQFPLAKLGALTAVTAGDIPYVHTLRWNGSLANQLTSAFYISLHQVVSESRSATGPWIGAALRQAQGCKALIERARSQDEISSGEWNRSCSFRTVLESTLEPCRNSANRDSEPACKWFGLAKFSQEVDNTRQLESAFGVLQEQQLLRNGGHCASPIHFSANMKRTGPGGEQ